MIRNLLRAALFIFLFGGAAGSVGAQTVALGSRTPGVMGTDEFRDRVAAISQQVGEMVHGGCIAERGRLFVPLPRVRKILRDVDAMFAELTQMSHCAGMAELGGSFIPHQRGREILGHAGPVFEHSAEIVHRAGMAAIGGIQIVSYCVPLLAPQRKRSAELEHESRIGRVAFKGRSTCCLCLRRLDLLGRWRVQADCRRSVVIEHIGKLRAFKDRCKDRCLCATSVR